MDKIKPFLKQLKKQHFWILLALVLIAPPIVWYSATTKLAADFAKMKGEILGKKQQAEQIQSKRLHPNPVFHKNQDELIGLRRQSVLEAWNKNYNRQIGLLVWPKPLGAEFLEAAAKLRNVEEVMQDKAKWDAIQLRPHLRDRYRNFIHLELPKLAEIVGAKWAPASARVPGVGPSGPSEKDAKEAPPLVQWSAMNQGQIVSGHFDWTKESDTRPSTLQVVYAQEDMWVLTAILNAIAKTNGKIEFAYQAKIKEILSIRLGKEAAVLEGQVRMPQPTEATPATAATTAMAPAATPAASTVAGAAGAAADFTKKPADMRYVDKLYKPLPADKIMNLGKVTDPAEAYLAVAKRMPVRIRLLIDSRRLNDFLVECGNSPLTIEVRQIRINPELATKDSGSRSSSVSGETGQGGRESKTTADQLTNHFFNEVEIYGIVYIFNAPNNERLGVPASPTPAGATPAGATPAGATPAGGTSPAKGASNDGDKASAKSKGGPAGEGAKGNSGTPVESGKEANKNAQGAAAADGKAAGGAAPPKEAGVK